MEWLTGAIAILSLLGGVVVRARSLQMLKEIKEAIQSCQNTIKIGKQALADGKLSETEIENIIRSIEKAFDEIEDVIRIGTKLWFSLKR